MPELPEVETIVRDLKKFLRHNIFSDVIVNDPIVLRQKAADFIGRLKGQSVEEVLRRGKAVIVRLKSGDSLVIQLMMTGQLIRNGLEDKHTRVVFLLEDGSRLLYNDQRRFGQIRVVAELSDIQHFNILGPEPFSREFTPALMRETFQKTNRPVKNVLLDHTFVAGIGNIYACEILFRSQISPRRKSSRITAQEIKTIHHEIIAVLKEAIVHRGSSMRNYRDGSGNKGRFNERLAVYARKDSPCLLCHKAIIRITQAGRSTFYCKQCQK